MPFITSRGRFFPLSITVESVFYIFERVTSQMQSLISRIPSSECPDSQWTQPPDSIIHPWIAHISFWPCVIVEDVPCFKPCSSHRTRSPIRDIPHHRHDPPLRQKSATIPHRPSTCINLHQLEPDRTPLHSATNTRSREHPAR